MRIVTGDYNFSVCDNYFNWNEESSRYGKMEYKTTTEQQKDEKYFCSNDCELEFIKQQRKKK